MKSATTSKRLLLAAALSGSFVVPDMAKAVVDAAKPAAIQSAAKPVGLKAVGPVMLSGSDASSAEFNAKVLPGIAKLVDVNLRETNKVTNQSILGIDLRKFVLAEESTIRAYFVGEGAGYHNSIGYITNTDKHDAINPSNASLIFPDASSSDSYLSSNTGVRSASEPLLAGDFVDLGTMKEGASFAPFIVSNGASGGKSIFTTDPAKNPDDLQHVVSFAMAIANSPYIIVAFEDLYGGGDRDYNDVIIAFDVGIKNAEAFAAGVAAPLPAAWVAGLGLMGVLALTKRRMVKPLPE